MPRTCFHITVSSNKKQTKKKIQVTSNLLIGAYPCILGVFFNRFYFLKFILFIFGCARFLLLCGLFSSEVSWGYSLVVMRWQADS